MKTKHMNKSIPPGVAFFAAAFLFIAALTGCTGTKQAPIKTSAFIGGALAPKWLTEPNAKPTLNRESMQLFRLLLADAALDADAIAKAPKSRDAQMRRQILAAKISSIGHMTRYYIMAPNASEDNKLFWDMLDTRADVLAESMLVYDVCYKTANWKEICSIARYQSVELKEMDRFCGLIEESLPQAASR